MKDHAKHRNRHRREIRSARTVLAETFPACFLPFRQAKRPLALSVGSDALRALPEIGAFLFDLALTDYTAGPTYLTACVEGAARVNLKGDDEGVVTPAQAAHAAEKLARFNAWIARQEKAPT